MIRDPGTEVAGAEADEVDVEVGMHWHEVDDIDVLMTVVQPIGRTDTGRIVVAGDIETAQRGRKVEGGEVVGRESGVR